MLEQERCSRAAASLCSLIVLFDRSKEARTHALADGPIGSGLLLSFQSIDLSIESYTHSDDRSTKQSIGTEPPFDRPHAPARVATLSNPAESSHAPPPRLSLVTEVSSSTVDQRGYPRRAIFYVEETLGMVSGSCPTRPRHCGGIGRSIQFDALGRVPVCRGHSGWIDQCGSSRSRQAKHARVAVTERVASQGQNFGTIGPYTDHPTLHTPTERTGQRCGQHQQEAAGCCGGCCC